MTITDELCWVLVEYWVWVLVWVVVSKSIGDIEKDNNDIFVISKRHNR
jgi:hypothetical protein